MDRKLEDLMDMVHLQKITFKNNFKITKNRVCMLRHLE
jgi:hypothetical protein